MTHWEFIEGELLIIDDPLTPQIGKNLRYSHLQEVVRYASMFPWRAILCYHGAFLEEIEQSRRDWSDQKSDLKERYLYPYSCNNVSGKYENVENVQFCYDIRKTVVLERNASSNIFANSVILCLESWNIIQEIDVPML